jgi:hypothetical protein
MSLGQVALGVASIVIGVNHLNNAAKRFRGAPLEGVAARRAMLTQSASVPMPGQPFKDSGRRVVLASNGAQVPMQMRSFNIRTLDDRIRYLRGLVDNGKRDPEVFAFARRALTKKCGGQWCIPEKDNLGEAKALFAEIRRVQGGDLAGAKKLFHHIRDNVRYTSDIYGVDTYQKPSHTIALKTADCDDGSTLTCSALQSIGIPCRFKVIRTKGARDWNHIYPQAGFPRANPKRWVSMDSSVNMPFGWEAPPKMVADSRVFRVG